jgi:hypothetical protein
VDGEALPIVVGVLLVALGAVGATVTQRRFEQEGRTLRALPLLVPFGVLVGAGAAMARGWELVPSMVVGAVLVPLVGLAGRLLEVRRGRRGG